MLFLGVLLVSPVPAVGAGEQAKPKREPIYAEDGKGMERVEQALVVAKRENKRVLLKIGGNWCPWCYKLSDLFHQDKAVQTILRDEYELVLIDSKADKPILEKCQITPDGYPYLAVLDSAGKEVIERVRKPTEEGGIPWFAFLAKDGHILITSTKPGTGNIGFPADPNTEIPYFVHMLRETRSKITDADIELIAVQLAGPK
jgi:hypothetical protein